jgi:hypothetical protein
LQLVLVVTSLLISEWDEQDETWRVSDLTMGRCSGFVLENFPQRVITAGHGLHNYDGKKLYTAARAWVIPVSGARAISLEDQGELTVDKLRRVGAIQVDAWSSLWPPTLRGNMLENYLGRHIPNEEFSSYDIAVLHLGDAFRDLQVPQPLQAWPKRLDVKADALGRMGLLLGNPFFPDLCQRIRWAGYSTWSSPLSEMGLAMTFNPDPAIQYVRGIVSKGMSGGPVVANLGERTGICLSLDIE